MKMKRKRASEIFAAVDPNLKVIDGGSRRRRRRKLSAQSMLDWQKLGGTKCPRCGQDALRFRPQDGVCIVCAGQLNEKELRDEKKRAQFLRYMRAHNARIGKRSHTGSSSLSF
jgi:uncharacterized Zn finger protein (UPF0148 family)